MLKSKVIYEVKEAVKAYSKEAKLTNNYILGVVNTVRSKYIRQHQKRNPGESRIGLTQTLLMEMEVVDKSYDITINTIDFTISRTKLALPKLIGKTFLKDVVVRSIDRISQEIEYMDKVRAIQGSSEQFIFAFLDDDMKLYFVNKQNVGYKFIKNIAVSAILEDPETIVTINNLDIELVEYPLTQELWGLLKPEVLEYMYNYLKIPVDTIDDNLTQQ